jgi:hypothetical protein
MPSISEGRLAAEIRRQARTAHDSLGIMAIDLGKALDDKIAELESRLTALKSARTALSSEFLALPPVQTTAATGRRRRKFNATQRAAISRRMKARWAKRKAAGQKSL